MQRHKLPSDWEWVCTLKINGGTGIIDLATQNEALLMKWIWKLQQQTSSQWSDTIRTLYEPHDLEQLMLNTNVSFFIKGLASLTKFCISSAIVDSQSGIITWKWTSDGRFSCASAYRSMHDCGLRCRYQRALWKMKIPPKVKIF